MLVPWAIRGWYLINLDSLPLHAIPGNHAVHPLLSAAFKTFEISFLKLQLVLVAPVGSFAPWGGLVAGPLPARLHITNFF